MARRALLVVTLGGTLALALWGANYWGLEWGREGLHVRLAYGDVAVGNWDRMPERPGWHITGFRYISTKWLPSLYTYGVNPNPINWEIWIPLWMPTLIFGSLAWVLYRPIRRRRQRAGLCVKCGYSLKGLTEPRCPECGSAFEKPP